MPLKDRTLNIPVPNDDEVTSPLLLSPYSEGSRQEQEQLAQSWKSPSQSSPSEDTLRYEKHVKDLEVLREQSKAIKESMKEMKRTAIELKERDLQKKKQKLEQKELLLERQKKDDESIFTLQQRRPGQPLSFFKRESNNIRKMNDKRKVRRNEKQKRVKERQKDYEIQMAAFKAARCVTVKREAIKEWEKRELIGDWEQRRTKEMKQHTLQVQQGMDVAIGRSGLKPAPFPSGKDNESDAETVLNSESDGTSNTPNKTPKQNKRIQVRSPTPPSRLSRRSVDSVLSKVSQTSRLSEGNPQQLFPHGSPCYGCKRRVCEFMRAIATTRRMCIKKFGAEQLALVNKNYSSNSTRRNKVYTIYKDHVSLKSLKDVPVCAMLMAMEWYPSSSNNRSTEVLREEFVKGNGKKLFSDLVYAERLLILQSTDSDNLWLD